MEKVTAAGRKRKTSLEESEWSTSKIRRLSSEAPENSASSAANYGNSTCEIVGPDRGMASCSSSDGSSELEKGNSKFVALEENEAVGGFFATSTGDSLDCTERREMTPSGEAEVEAGALVSTARPSVSDSTIEKMPSEAAVEEFFASAEKNLLKKFMDKYNFDFVKDQPLEGRYEWVQVQTNP